MNPTRLPDAIAARHEYEVAHAARVAWEAGDRAARATIGHIAWTGPSALDPGTRIALTASGTNSASASRNTKTGAMVQLAIVPADLNPSAALGTRAERAICGDCPHSHQPGADGDCYVTVSRGPLSSWRAAARGRYATDWPAFRAAITGKIVRLGTYGDPAALPLTLVQAVCAHASRWTGYTHQWRTRPGLRPYLMASCDTPQEATQARAQGWRTFRVMRAYETIMPGEILCPASAEAGKRTTCTRCCLCDGSRHADGRASIAIYAHGATVRRFNPAKFARNWARRCMGLVPLD